VPLGHWPTGALNKTSIKPVGYGERFVKRLGLFCLVMANAHAPLDAEQAPSRACMVSLRRPEGQ
jgi:hypothetical protein